MWRIAAILAAIAAFVYVAVAGVQWLQPRVEEDIANRVNTALAEQGLLWADVAVDGRQVVLGGEAPDQDAHDRALTVAGRVFGVAGISDATVVAEAVSGTAPVKAGKVQPYQLTIEKGQDRMVVRGQVASEQDADVIRRIIRTHYDGMTVEDALEVTPNAPAGWRSAVGVVLMNITNLEQAQITISGTEVMLEGEVLDQKYSDQLQNMIRSALPSGYKVAFAVDVVTPTSLTTSDTASPSDAVSATVSNTVAVEKAEDKAVKTETKVETITSAKNDSAAIGKLITSQTVARDAKRKAEPVVKAPETVAGDCSGIADAAKQTVYFDFDKAAMKPEYRPVIRKVASALKGCTEQHMVVAGFTDKTGSKLYNQWLSQQRAESGVRALRREGVNGGQLTATGYGEQNPTHPNTNIATRSKNRRIEFHPGEAETAADSTAKDVVPAKAALNETVSSSDTVNDSLKADAAEPTSPSTSWWSALLGLSNKTGATAASETVSKTVVSSTSK